MSTLEIAAQLGTAASGLVAAIAIFVALRTYRHQTNAQVFIEYTRRYQEVMASFPLEARAARLDSEGQLPRESTELSLAALRYLNLCSEEFYLCRRGYLARDVWRIWEGELKRMLRSPLLEREWRKLSSEFQAYSAFRSYVDSVQADGTDLSKAD